VLFKLSVNCTLVAVTGPTLAILNVNTVWYVVAFTFIKVDAVLAPATCWPKNVGLFSSGSFGLPSPSGSGSVPAPVVSVDVWVPPPVGSGKLDVDATPILLNDVSVVVLGLKLTVKVTKALCDVFNVR
jgi:hypothetical protein